MILSGLIEIAEIIIEIVESKEFEAVFVFEIISLIAPVLPAIFGVKDLQKMGLIFSKQEVTFKTK